MTCHKFITISRVAYGMIWQAAGGSDIRQKDERQKDERLKK